MKNPTDKRAQRSKKALLRAGLEQLNVNREASLSDIAAHAKVGRATLYRQYENRESLIKAVAIYCFDRFDEVTSDLESEAQSGMDAIRIIFKQVMPLTEEFQFLINLENFIDDYPEIDEMNKKIQREMFELIEYAKNEGSVDKSLPTDWIAHFIDGLFVAGWLQIRSEKYTDEEVSKLAFQSFRKAVRPSIPT